MNTLYQQVAALHTVLVYWQKDSLMSEPLEAEIFRIHEKRYKQIIRAVMHWTYDHAGTPTDIRMVTNRLDVLFARLQLLKEYKRACKILRLIPLKETVDRMDNDDLRSEIIRLGGNCGDDEEYDENGAWQVYTPSVRAK